MVCIWKPGKNYMEIHGCEIQKKLPAPTIKVSIAKIVSLYRRRCTTLPISLAPRCETSALTIRLRFDFDEVVALTHRFEFWWSFSHVFNKSVQENRFMTTLILVRGFILHIIVRKRIIFVGRDQTKYFCFLITRREVLCFVRLEDDVNLLCAAIDIFICFDVDITKGSYLLDQYSCRVAAPLPNSLYLHTNSRYRIPSKIVRCYFTCASHGKLSVRVIYSDFWVFRNEWFSI